MTISQDRRKVLFLVESLGGGGAEKVLSTLVKNIDKEKFDVTVCSVVNVGKYIKNVKDCVRYKYIVKDSSTLLGKIKYKLVYRVLPLKWVYDLFVPKNNDVEVAFVEGFSTLLLSYSRNRLSRKIAWVHCDMKNLHWTKMIYHSQEEEASCYNRFDQICTVSETARQSFIEVFPSVSTPIITVYNPVDREEIIHKAQELI